MKIKGNWIVCFVLPTLALSVAGEANGADRANEANRATSNGGAKEQPLVSFVNPMVGTDKMGHTYPGAAAPFGLVALSPDTDMVPHNIGGVYQPGAYAYCAGYQYRDKTIVGFSHTHFNGTGHSDLGDILMMPTVGAVQLDAGTAGAPEDGYRSRFSHEREHAEPGYYSVMLDDYGVRAELTATERVGVHRYTYPQGVAEGNVILDLDYGIYNYEGKTLMANLWVQDDYTLAGYRITRGWSRMNYTHFVIRFSKPIVRYGCRDAVKPDYIGFWRKFDMTAGFPEMFGERLTAWFTFDVSDGEPLEARVALSPVDMRGAAGNLAAEAPAAKTFDDIVSETSAKWERELSVARIDTDEEGKRVFYTALYRTMLNPSVYQDVDGRYRGIDHNIHTAARGRTNYTVFSVWDTFRAEHPLLNIIKRSRSEQFVGSMLDHYRQSVHGALPVWSHMGNENWCMTGFHSVSVLADALVKGIKMDRDTALEAAVSSANVGYYDGLAEYRHLGYVPSDASAVSASTTLEYAYDDWAVGALAARLGKRDEAEKFFASAQGDRRVFDPSTGFARPRDSYGIFKAVFDPLETHNMGFIEGNSWNYSFFVPHDVEGLIGQTGGPERFAERLDSLFKMELPARYFAHTEDITEEGLMGNYVHGNEPSHHVAYLYAWTQQPWKGQARLHDIMRRMYRDRPDGLCGNDDCGQMSAWYIFSVMGFYPVCPGSDQYVLGSPFAKEVVLALENGKRFTVRAEGLSHDAVYVRSVRLNGKPYDKAYITHGDIMAGGELTFEMSAEPNTARLFTAAQRPYSLTKAE
jgi:predicted alpha-1,2-mannosidase